MYFFVPSYFNLKQQLKQFAKVLCFLLFEKSFMVSSASFWLPVFVESYLFSKVLTYWCCACCYTCDNYRMIYTFLLNVPNYNKWNIVSFGVKTASLQPYWLHSNALMMRDCLNCRKDIFSQESYLKRLVSCSLYHVFPVQI